MDRLSSLIKHADCVLATSSSQPDMPTEKIASGGGAIPRAALLFSVQQEHVPVASNGQPWLKKNTKALRAAWDAIPEKERADFEGKANADYDVLLRALQLEHAVDELGAAKRFLLEKSAAKCVSEALGPGEGPLGGVALTPGTETSWLATTDCFIALQEAVTGSDDSSDTRFEAYVRKMWSILATIRAQAFATSTKNSPLASMARLGAALRGAASYSRSCDTVDVSDIGKVLCGKHASGLHLVLRPPELRLMRLHFNTAGDGRVRAGAFVNAVRGVLSDRLMSLASFIIDVGGVREVQCVLELGDSLGKVCHEQYRPHLILAMDAFKLRLGDGWSSTSPLSHGAWVTVFADYGASLNAGQYPAHFEELVLVSFSRDGWISQWKQICAPVMHERAATIPVSKDTVKLSVLNAEAGKRAALRRAIGMKRADMYERDLHNALRRTRASLVSVCGSGQSIGGPHLALTSAPSFDPTDNKLTREEFECVLRRYGVLLRKTDLRVLELHFDDNASGHIRVDSFLHYLEGTPRNGPGTMRAERGAPLRQWTGRVWQTILPHLDCTRPSVKKRRGDARRLRAAMDSVAGRYDAILVAQRTLEECTHNAGALSASGCGLTTLPRGAVFRNVRHVWANANRIRFLSPVFFESHPRIESLDLSGNQMRTMPAVWKLGATLTVLNLSRNDIINFPNSVCRALPRLRELDLSHNKLRSLPTNMGNFSQLSVLSLESNFLKFLPESMMLLSETLSWLLLGHNKLRTLPQLAWSYFSALQVLTLHENRLRALPEDFGGFSSLRMLTLHGNKLAALPAPFGKCPLLERLTLNGNTIAELPKSFSELSSLRYLRLDHNHLATLPNTIDKLERLQELQAHENRLLELPNSLHMLKELQRCCFHKNRLQVIPQSLPARLRALTLHNNQLVELPDAIGLLEDLKSLTLHNNQLGDLPETFGNLTMLESLRICPNPLVPALLRVADGAYFESFDEQNDRILATKLIDGLRLIGSGGLATRLDAVRPLEPGEPDPVPSHTVCGSRFGAEQLLESAFARFASSNEPLIPDDDFTSCLETVGILLSRAEVDTLSERFLDLYGVESSLGGTLVSYEKFVRFVGNISRRRRHTPSVAHSVVKFCMSRNRESTAVGIREGLEQQVEEIREELECMKDLREDRLKERKELTAHISRVRCNANKVQLARAVNPSILHMAGNISAHSGTAANESEGDPQDMWALLLQAERLKRERRRAQGQARGEMIQMDRLKRRVERLEHEGEQMNVPSDATAAALLAETWSR